MSNSTATSALSHREVAVCVLVCQIIQHTDESREGGQDAFYAQKEVEELPGEHMQVHLMCTRQGVAQSLHGAEQLGLP